MSRYSLGVDTSMGYGSLGGGNMAAPLAAAAGPLAAAAGIGEGLGGLGKFLFGSGGGTTRQWTDFRPEDRARIEQAMGQLPGAQAGFLSMLQGLQSQAGQTPPQLFAQRGTAANVQGFSPQFSLRPDALAQQQIALGREASARQTSAAQEQLAQQFRQNPAMARAMSQQAATTGMLQQNPLLMQALEQQTGREMGQQQLGLQAVQAANQARLAQMDQQTAMNQAFNQALLQQFGLGQAARGEQFGYGQAGLQSQMSLPQLLAQMGQTMGTQVQKKSGGGLFEMLGLT